MRELNGWIKCLSVLPLGLTLSLLLYPACHQQEGPLTWVWSCSRVRLWVSVKLPGENFDCHRHFLNKVESKWTETELNSKNDQNLQRDNRSSPKDAEGHIVHSQVCLEIISHPMTWVGFRQHAGGWGSSLLRSLAQRKGTMMPSDWNGEQRGACMDHSSHDRGKKTQLGHGHMRSNVWAARLRTQMEKVTIRF